MTSNERPPHLRSAPSSRGKTALVKHLRGERLTQRQAIVAKCCDCMGHHIDGRLDCRMPHCPLYPWMPYRTADETGHPGRPGAFRERPGADGSPGPGQDGGLPYQEAPEGPQVASQEAQPAATADLE